MSFFVLDFTDKRTNGILYGLSSEDAVVKELASDFGASIDSIFTSGKQIDEFLEKLSSLVPAHSTVFIGIQLSDIIHREYHEECMGYFVAMCRSWSRCNITFPATRDHLLSTRQQSRLKYEALRYVVRDGPCAPLLAGYISLSVGDTAVRIVYDRGRKQRLVKNSKTATTIRAKGVFYVLEDSLLAGSCSNLSLDTPYPVHAWKSELAVTATTWAGFKAVLELLDDHDVSIALLSQEVRNRITWPCGKMYKHIILSQPTSSSNL